MPKFLCFSLILTLISKVQAQGSGGNSSYIITTVPWDIKPFHVVSPTPFWIYADLFLGANMFFTEFRQGAQMLQMEAFNHPTTLVSYDSTALYREQFGPVSIRVKIFVSSEVDRSNALQNLNTSFPLNIPTLFPNSTEAIQVVHVEEFGETIPDQNATPNTMETYPFQFKCRNIPPEVFSRIDLLDMKFSLIEYLQLEQNLTQLQWGDIHIGYPQVETPVMATDPPVTWFDISIRRSGSPMQHQALEQMIAHWDDKHAADIGISLLRSVLDMGSIPPAAIDIEGDLYKNATAEFYLPNMTYTGPAIVIVTPTGETYRPRQS